MHRAVDRYPRRDVVESSGSAGPAPDLERHLSLRDDAHRGAALTPREREVLQLAADGRSTREIADVLVLSPCTVKTHFQHIYEKLEVPDRTAAVAHCMRRGLIV